MLTGGGAAIPALLSPAPTVELKIDQGWGAAKDKNENARLLLALNGVGTASFDPQPAVARFLNDKARRKKGNQTKGQMIKSKMQKVKKKKSETRKSQNG